MKSLLFAVTSSMVLAAAVPARGAAIVDATGATPGSLTTISAALAGVENEIIVKNTGLYNEALMITRNVILRGEDPLSPPVVALKGNPTQPTLGPGDGIYAGGTVGGSGNQSIEIKNFVFIPSLTDPIADDGFSVTSNAGAELTFKLDNVLCAPNDGADKPTAISVWDNPTPGTSVPGAWFYLMADSTFGGFAGSIDATVTSSTFIGAGTDATVFYTGPTGSLSVAGLGMSHSGRYGSQIDGVGPITITGSKDIPGWVTRKNLVGTIIFGAGLTNIDNFLALDNGNTGLRVDVDTVATLNLSQSLFVRNRVQGLYLPFDPLVPKAWTVSDTTLLGNGIDTSGVWGNIEATGTAAGALTLTITDSVVAGGNTAPGIESSSANIIVNNSAIVTAGTYALPTATVGPVTLNNVINDDPLFISTDTDPLLATSFDVTSLLYATASSTNGALNGWGEGPNSSVSHWTLY